MAQLNVVLACWTSLTAQIMAIDRSKQFHSTGHLVIINIYVFLCYRYADMASESYQHTHKAQSNMGLASA